MTSLRAVCLTLLSLIQAGCGGPSSGPSLVPVRGTVTLNDRPLSCAVVTFIPTGSTRGGMATGRTGPDGTYTLRSREGAGALPGEYRVVISKRVMPDGSDVPADDTTPPMDSPARESLPAYSDANRPILTAIVPDNGGTIDFPLGSRTERR